MQVYEEMDGELQKHFEDHLAEVGRLPTNVLEEYMGWGSLTRGSRRNSYYSLLSKLVIIVSEYAGSQCGRGAELHAAAAHKANAWAPIALQRGVDAELGAYLLPLIHERSSGGKGRSGRGSSSCLHFPCVCCLCVLPATFDSQMERKLTALSWALLRVLAGHS